MKQKDNHHGRENGREDDSSTPISSDRSSNDLSLGDRSKPHTEPTIGMSGESLAHQVSSFHGADSANGELTRTGSAVCSGGVSGHSIDDSSHCSPDNAGFEKLAEGDDDSSSLPPSTKSRIAESAAGHGDRVFRPGSLIQKNHNLLSLPTSESTSESTVHQDQDQDQDQDSPKNRDTQVLRATSPTLESTNETGQDETENHGTPGLRKNAHTPDATLYSVGNSNKKKLISLMIIWSSKLVMKSY